LADQVAEALTACRASLGEELYLEDRLLVLVRQEAATDLVRRLHEFTVSQAAVPGGQ